MVLGMPIGIMQISETRSDIHCGCDVNGDMVWYSGKSKWEKETWHLIPASLQTLPVS